MNDAVLFSIIIPFQGWMPNLDEYLEYIRRLQGSFLPLFFRLFCFVALIAFVIPLAERLFFSIGLYIAAFSKSVTNIRCCELWFITLFRIPYILMSHIEYGTRFIQCILRRNDHSNLGR